MREEFPPIFKDFFWWINLLIVDLKHVRPTVNVNQTYMEIFLNQIYINSKTDFHTSSRVFVRSIKDLMSFSVSESGDI